MLKKGTEALVSAGREKAEAENQYLRPCSLFSDDSWVCVDVDP